MMDIANLDAALSALSSVSQGSLASVVGTAVLDQSLELTEELGASMLQMMERSVTPELGGNIDIRV